MIRFEAAGVNEAGEKIYNLTIDGEVIREKLTIDQAVEIINRRDEERLGWEHRARETEDESPGRCGGKRGVEDAAPYKEEYPSARRTPGSSPSRGAYKERDFNGHDPV